MTETERLLAIESIRKVKAEYWYYLDAKNWDRLAQCFAKDAIVDFRGERDLKPGQPVTSLPPVEEALVAGDPATHRGREQIVGWLADLLQSWLTIHHGHAPIIEVTGAGTATGIWPLYDYISDGTRTQEGWGHYHETYIFEDGAWRIAYLGFTRLRTSGVHPAAFVSDK